MSDLVVRDHSQPCEHGDRNESGKIPRFLFGDEWMCDVCPGGREIVLRQMTLGDLFDGWKRTEIVYVVVEEA